MTDNASSAAPRDGLFDDTLALLRELISNACVNDYTPDSGQEVRNVETLERFFSGSDVEAQRFEPHPGRVSAAFRVPGSDADTQPLTFLGHIDVVKVDEDQWNHDPFAAEVIDDVLYGRGAMDMLFITATMAAVTRWYSNQQQRPGTLTFVALADEEARGGLGAKWISDNAPESIDWSNCLSETGGSHLPVADGSDAVVINVGEKGAAQRRLHVTGDAGHGSTPLGRDSAIVKIGRVAEALSHLAPPLADGEIWRGFVRAFRFDDTTEDALITGSPDADYSVFGDLAAYADAFSHTTFSQTVLRSGTAINVLPARAYLEMDIRPLPGQTQEEIDDLLESALGELASEVTIEHLITEPATQSPAEGPLWEAMSATIAESFPEAEIVPVLATGGSDLRFARRLGGVGYGFALHGESRSLSEVNQELHSHDEKLHLVDLALTLDAYRRLTQRFFHLA